jgi:hypothetical protein
MIFYFIPRLERAWQLVMATDDFSFPIHALKGVATESKIIDLF